MQEACTHCGTEIPRAPGLEGMCPACLARAAALPEPGAASLPIPGVQILSKVGEGGMGVVYAGVQTDLDRAVAVKVLSPVHVSDPAFVRRFMDEARAAARVSDPNVVGIYDVGRSDGNCYLVMEFVEGESLDKRLKRGPIPWRDALPVMTQTLRALAAIHEQGLLHRDVKPSNIMVDPAGRAKLVDFGLARPARADDGSRLPIGTPKYLSPEQARGEELDARSDLYGLGVTFYEMLSGRNPARGETANALLLWHASPDSFADPLCRAAPGVPAELGCVVDRMIQKSARRRYRSAPAALDALEAAAGTASVRRPPWRLVAAGAVALAAIGTLLLVAMRTCGKKTGPTPAAREPAPPVSEPRPEETASKAEEALRRGEYSLAEELARRLARDFPAKSADLIERIRTARESAVRSPGVFGTPESFLLEFDPEDGVLSEDGETLFLIDLAAGALSAVSLREKKETRRVPLAPEPVRLDRRGGLIFVACKSGCILTLGEKTLEVVRRTDIPDGKPSAVAAPPRDADRVYAADGDRLYVIRTSTGGIVQTLEHAAAVGHAGRPVHVCAHPEGSRVYVWATGDRAPAGCARFEREGREDLSQGIRLHHPGPLSFDPLGEFALWESEITPDQKWTSSRTNFTVMAADFHPDVPWCITFTPSMG
ncbi:MAG: serine/threonine protein kinase, partial [Planctomycetes bacterium]|nr:serine/threonine protein kinase [Planctomycetota bacterium]